MTNSPAATRDDAQTGERAIEKIACPFERVKAINAIVREDGTLPGPLARLRHAALQEGRSLTKSVTELADKVGMKRSRVSTLLNHPAPAMQPSAAGGR